MKNNENNQINNVKYGILGMHCASCGILIEKKILNIKNIKSVSIDQKKAEINIKFVGLAPSRDELNTLFKDNNYIFTDLNNKINLNKKADFSHYLNYFFPIFLVLLFFLLLKTNFLSVISIDTSSSLAGILLFGIIAGCSTCSALVGGLVLSISSQWSKEFGQRNSVLTHLTPHLIFNFGRLFSFTIFGAVLGFVGKKIQLFSVLQNVSSLLVLLISTVMIGLGLQMLGVKYFANFGIRIPKKWIKKITREQATTKNDYLHKDVFAKKFQPLILGALTIFLPCGFTLTAQAIALLSGGWIQGGLIMLFFSLGTMFPLLLIGLTSVSFLKNIKLRSLFQIVAGWLVIFFAIFNINNQINAMGLNINDFAISFFSQQKINKPKQKNDEKNLAPIIDGKQVIKMEASSAKYTPNHFFVRKGVSVRWEITDTGTSGCTNTIIAKNLISEPIFLSHGKVSVREFTPEKPGIYKFSCSMGMVTGIIEVL